MTRPIISFPFDTITKDKQVTGNTYAGIIKSLHSEHRSTLMSVFKTHFIELSLRAQSTYFLYKYLILEVSSLDPQSCLRHPVASQLAITSVMSFCDILFTNPFERMKVAYIRKLNIPFIQNSKLSLYDLYSNRSWVFQGSLLTFQSSFIHLNVFLTSNTFLKQWMFGKEKEVSFMEACMMGPLISTIQASVTFPLLTLRAQLHAERMRSVRSPLSVFMFVKQLYKNQQLMSLYNGWGSRVVRGSFMACFDSYWINYINSSKSK